MRKVSANTARQRLGDLLDSVFYEHDEVVIERLGKPVGVIIPIQRYEALQRDRQESLEAVDRLRAANADVPDEEIEAEVAAAVAEVRAANPGATMDAAMLSLLTPEDQAACIEEVSRTAVAALQSGRLVELNHVLARWRATALATWDEQRRRDRSGYGVDDARPLPRP